jgi:16S rRNA (guanine527-N7)-methyltransferase
VLLDANGKKAAFLTQVTIELSLRNVTVAPARVEDYRPDSAFDVIVARAFSDLASFAQGASRHLAPDGILAAMKGAYPQEEIALLPYSIAVVAAPSIEIPGLQAQRHLIVMRAARASDHPERAR